MRDPAMMTRMVLRCFVIAFLFISLEPLAARAGEHNCCPPGEYSRLHYWAPRLVRLQAQRCGPTLNVYAPDRHPGIPADSRITSFPCPAVRPVGNYSEGWLYRPSSR